MLNRKLATYSLLFILLALLPLAFGQLSHFVADVMTGVAIFVILAVSADLVVGLAGLITLGHGAFFAIGAYSSAILSTRYGISPVFALLAGLVVSTCVSWVVGRAVLHLKGYYLAMATLGLTAVMVTLLMGTRSWTGGAAGMGGIPRFSIATFQFADTHVYYLLVLAVALLVIAFAKKLADSAYGRALIAIHGDEQTATALGIDTARYKVSVFVLSCVLASLAGSFFAHHLRFIAPDDFTISQSIHILVMAFLGGIGSIYGAAMGAVTLQALPELVHELRDYELLGTGLILIAVLVLFPRGLYGLCLQLGRKLGLTKHATEASR